MEKRQICYKTKCGSRRGGNVIIGESFKTFSELSFVSDMHPLNILEEK